MKSIWQDTQLPWFPPLREHIHTDVLVIGGGMAGLLCAHTLQNAGIRCIVAEARDIAGGITKNTTAKITSQHGLVYHKFMTKFGHETAGLYLQANETAISAFRQLCRDMDCDFREQNSYVYSTTSRQKLEDELSALQTLGYPAELTEDLPLPFPTLGAVRFPHQAQFHPLKFLAAIASQLTIFENTPVRELVKNTAITDHGSITAENIIVATHFPFLNKHGSYFLKLYQHRSYVCAYENAPVFKGMYVDEDISGFSFRSYGKYLIAGGDLRFARLAEYLAEKGGCVYTIGFENAVPFSKIIS